MPTRNRQLHALVPRQPGVERRGDGLHDPQAGTYGARGVVLVRLGPAQVDEQPVPQILGDVAREALDDLGGSRLVGADDLAQVLGVEPAGQDGRVREVAEHHRQLAPPGLPAVFGHRRGRGGGLSRGQRGELQPRDVPDRSDAGHRFGRPHQALPALLTGEPPEGELLPRRVQERLVAVEDVRERSIGHTALAL